MIDSFATQCPHCHTRFRITRSQLGAAQGLVRCGACLHVFNAAQQPLGKQLLTPVATLQADQTSAASAPAGHTSGRRIRVVTRRGPATSRAASSRDGSIA